MLIFILLLVIAACGWACLVHSFAVADHREADRSFILGLLLVTLFNLILCFGYKEVLC